MTGTIITKKGVQLLVKLLATKGNLNFSRVAIGTGSIPSGYDPASMIDLIEYKKDGVISRCEADNDVAKITMQVSSIGVETGFTMTEIGVFAEDPDLGEILYSYLDMREDPQYIYAEGGDAEKYVEITLEVAIEASTKVTAYINPDSLVTRAEFEEELLKVKNNFGTEDFDDSGEIEGIESFTDFMSSFVKGTSISEFLANLKAGLKFVLHAGHLVNNGMCETPGEFALDAAYGKTLTDQITQLYSEITDTKWFKLIVDVPFVYSVASNATTTVNLKYVIPAGYIAVGLVRVSSLHNSVLVCGFNQGAVILHSVYAYSINNSTGYATVLCAKKEIIDIINL